MLRTFFAVEIGDAARRAARAAAERLAGEPGGDAVRWTRPEAYHVTLRFLGPTRREQIPGLVGAVREASAEVAPFALRLAALHGFPTPRRPRVVVIDLEPAEPIVRLAAAVERAVVAQGVAPEERAFHPHLTLGRKGRRPRSEPEASEVHQARVPFVVDPTLGPRDSTPFHVASLVLFQSTLARDGSLYTPLERIPLRGA